MRHENVRAHQHFLQARGALGCGFVGLWATWPARVSTPVGNDALTQATARPWPCPRPCWRSHHSSVRAWCESFWTASKPRRLCLPVRFCAPHCPRPTQRADVALAQRACSDLKADLAKRAWTVDELERALQSRPPWDCAGALSGVLAWWRAQQPWHTALGLAWRVDSEQSRRRGESSGVKALLELEFRNCETRNVVRVELTQPELAHALAQLDAAQAALEAAAKY